MRIAFDLDDTLIPCGKAAFPTELSAPKPLCPLARLALGDCLRQGARDLLRALHRQGHEIWVYTTSDRSPLLLRLWFLLQGVPLGGVVNWHKHDNLMHAGHCPDCSKYPPAFGIDLLVDDAAGVGLEGERHGFNVLVVSPSDPDWAQHILQAVTPDSLSLDVPHLQAAS